jgi:hypothetical protein
MNMKRTKKDPNVYPPGLNAAKVKRIIDYYDRQTAEEAAEEITSAPLAGPTAWIEVPQELVPKVRKLIASHKKSA